MNFKYINTSFLILLISYFLLSACRPSVKTPKPKGYFKVEFPEKEYRHFNDTNYPFSFDYPVYGQIQNGQNTESQNDDPYWLNIYVPLYDATVYLSYKTISKNQTLDQLIDESYRLSYAHDIRADYIKTPEFVTPNHIKGTYYFVGGNAASSYQFYLTDEEKHFIRGSLYFNIAPNADSLKPMSDFMKQDLDYLIETFKFK